MSAVEFTGSLAVTDIGGNMNPAAGAPVTDPQAPVSASIPRRLLFAIVVAVVLDIIVVLISSAVSGPLSVAPQGAPAPITITALTIIPAIVIPMVLVGIVVWLVARRAPAVRTWAAWAGLAFGVLSGLFLFSLGADLATTLTLLTLHAIAGVAWFVALTARKGV